MSARKAIREVHRAYQFVARHVEDDAFVRAHAAIQARLYGPVAAVLGTDPNTLEHRLFEQVDGEVFHATLVDEMLVWRQPDGTTLCEDVLAERQLRKRPLARQYLERLLSSTPRLWHVVDARIGEYATVRTPAGDEPPRRVELMDPSRRIAPGDRVVARRVRVGDARVLAEGWIALPEGAMPVLQGMENEALTERAFCLKAFIALGDSTATDRWLSTLTVPGRDGERAPRGADPHRGRAGGSASPPPPRRPARGTERDDPERERLLERIRKLFAMAQETEASPHEAEIALRRCQSLMTRFGITEADLESSEFGVVSVSTGRTVASHVKLLGGAVAVLHDVIFVVGRGGLAEFRGYEIDVQVATLTFDYLRQSVERALSARKYHGELAPGRSAAFDYRIAFSKEVYDRVMALSVERAEAERLASGTANALTVRKREQVDHEFGEGLVDKPIRLRGPRDGDAADAGREDGREVSLDPQIDR